jgi:RNA polymerase sigma-70 factor (ECF subfamily)
MDRPTAPLIAQAAAGDAAAFARLVESSYPMIYAAAYKWCASREDAEDIAQEVCAKLPEKLGSFRAEARFSSWLYRVTLNAVHDYGRTAGRHRRRERPFAEGFDPASADIPADRQLAARRALAEIHALPAELRDALLLVYAEGLSHREAAQVLGCAETTVSWRIFRARGLLKKWNERHDQR